MGGFGVEFWAAGSLEELATIVSRRLKSSGLMATSDPSESERSILLEGRGSEWVSIVDDEAQAQAKDYFSLAEAVSAELNRPVVSLLEHDGEQFEFILFAGGSAADRWCSDPEFFGLKSKRAKRGASKVWAAALGLEEFESKLAVAFARGDFDRARHLLVEGLEIEAPAEYPARPVPRRALEEGVLDALATETPFSVHMVFDYYQVPRLPTELVASLMRRPDAEAAKAIAEAAVRAPASATPRVELHFTRARRAAKKKATKKKSKARR